MRMNFQDRTEGDDVVVPKDSFNFWEVGFGEIGAGIDGTIVDTANFKGQRVSLWRNQEICA